MLGCGAQAWPQLAALADLLPLAEGRTWDRDPARAAALARLAGALGIALEPATDVGEATAGAEVIVTCTTAREPFLGPEHVAPGAFIAAVGADWPQKNELRPGLFRAATVVADVRAQALAMGDTRHAVAAGAFDEAAIHAELGEVVAGLKAGRTREDEIVIFDSTGVAIQDVAAAAMAFELANAQGVGNRIVLAPLEAAA
jgi:ornithine cyclodeaminase/alanine dehydrogenase-like protein (mu-crystallin family)